MKSQVFVVDDDNDLCHSIQWLLESVGIEVKTFNNGPDFLAALQPQQIGCILLDIRMPVMSGLEVQEQLNLRHNTLPIIFMTGHGDVPMAVCAMKAGAMDFLTKPYSDQIILEKIQRALSHHQQISLKNQKESLIAKRYQLLTIREQEVLKLIVKGSLNKEIAHQLNISMKTVELHRSHVMQKMQVVTVAELVTCYLLIQAPNVSVVT